MTEPPTPSPPDEPWGPGGPGHLPPQGGAPRPGPGPGQQADHPADPYPQQPYPQQPYPQPGYGGPGGYPQQPYPQPGYGQPGGYPQGDYPQAQYPPASPAKGAGFNLTARIGPRLTRRPEARFSISLAAVGVVLAIVGVIIWAGGYLASGLSFNFDGNGGPTTSGEGRRFLGAALSLIVVAVGYALVILRRLGALATAGVVASAVGVPLTMVFLTLDYRGLFRGQFPISVDAVFLVSILVWLVSYFLVPGAQGRAFYLALAALFLPGYIVSKAQGTDLVFSAVSSVSGSSSRSSSTDTVAAIALVFGVGYYLIAAYLDKRHRSGAAVALVVAAFNSTVGGVIAAVPSLHQLGTGVLLIVLGAVLACYGGYFGRRFTTWFWSFGLVLGIGLVVQKILPDSTTGSGITLIVIGAVVVLVAHLFSTLTNEAPEFPPAESEAAVVTR